ncbi:MAG: hypothetical protein A3I72_14730 [Candidatus Tectomicrobia bacterium RIFCSPLOWO2_02_FULL_70_19]|nr:MAG: hypothetical protein A3I72_14730 [Candidatus Tectomicrobia bacterium RIFCSPLOWO2_02_FULL_70_19]
MRWNRLSVKLMSAVGSASLLAIGIFAWVSITTQRDQLVGEMTRSASQFSDTVKRSTRHAMLENQWEMAFHIMDAIGQQEAVHRVRVFSKEGVILFSSDRREKGQVVDKRAEACYACHAVEQPLERLNVPERARIFGDGKGNRVLGMITPIYNEPTCSRGGCHNPAKSVLGVLDIGLSLSHVDSDIAATTRKTVIFAAAMTFLILCTLGIFLHWRVVGPVSDLLRGTERVAEGDLAYEIPVRAGDEIGLLAVSFNEMTGALQKTKRDLDSLVETLEEQVEDRTKALKEAQDQLIQSEKLASLGKLSASIAHEINNPLAGILTYAKLLTKRLKSAPADPKTLEQVSKSLPMIERETERCSVIVRSLLDFARQREPLLQEVNVNDVIGEALSLLMHQMVIKGISVERHLEDLPAVWADHGQLRQVFVNIAMNACEAMSKGMTLTVNSCLLPDEGMIKIEFSDTGVGISGEDVSKIFDPFFTTKEKGTGLGLSVVYGIIHRHGGRVDIKSQVGKGTSVAVRLPLAREPAQTMTL